MPAPLYAALAQLPEALRSERRGWGWNSLTRHQFAPVAQSRGDGLKPRAVSVQIWPGAPFCRPCSPRQRHDAQTFESAGASPATGTIWNVNRMSGPGLFAKQRAPGNGSVVQVHGIPPIRARAVQREPPPYKRVALDQCRASERYRTRAPFSDTAVEPGLRWVS